MRRGCILACLLAASSVCSGVGTDDPAPIGRYPTAVDRLQGALASLNRHRLAEAEQTALSLASHAAEPMPRAWLIVGAARQRLGRYRPAAEAYAKYLATTRDPEVFRAFASEQVRRCRLAMDSPAVPKPPSSRLDAGQRRALAAVGKRVQTEATEHFVVHARNPRVARLIAVEAEDALRRICQEIVPVDAFPHAVEIHVWADQEEYLANAEAAPEWSGGMFRIEQRDGVSVRRIDLTQVDDSGRFDTTVLDRVLPHEMCHMVLREYFGEATCPLALEEGLAILAEADPQADRMLLAGAALVGEAPPSMEDLFLRHRYDVDSPGVFYAKAYSAVVLLYERMTREQLGDFLDHVKAGRAVGDAIQRALFVPPDGTFVPTLERVWQEQTILQAQYLQALGAASEASP